MPRFGRPRRARRNSASSAGSGRRGGEFSDPKIRPDEDEIPVYGEPRVTYDVRHSSARGFAFATVLALVAGASATVYAQKDSDVAAFFDQFTANRNDIVQLEAKFVQTTVTPDETTTSTGAIIYARTGSSSEGVQGKRLVFRYDDPPLEYMIDGLTAYEYDPELKQIQIYELEDRPEAEAFYLGFDSNTDRLMQAYSVQLQPPAESNPGGTAVALVPKDPDSEDALFEMVVLQLRPSDLLPIQIHIINSSDSDTSYAVSDFEVSRDLDPSKITIHVPEGTAIVDQDEYAGEAPEGGTTFPLPDASEPGLVHVDELDKATSP